MAFVDTTQELLDVMESLIKDTLGQILSSHLADVELYTKLSGEKGNMENVERLLGNDFKVLSYNEAVDILAKAKTGLKTRMPKLGEGFSREHELYLVEKHCRGVPVFIVDWDPRTKPFYARVGGSSGETENIQV